MRRLLLLLGALAAFAVPAAAQTPAATIEAARARLDQLDPDSAYVLLRAALAAGPAGAVRVRAFTLLGLAELIRGNRTAARQAFEQALRIDNSLRIDSLADLHSDTRLVFGEARTSVAPARVFIVSVSVPDSTLIVPREGILPIELRPTGRARVVTTIASIETPLDVVWSDTQSVDIAATARWNLAGRDSQPVRDGRYVLRVTATEASGQVAPAVERYLVLERQPVDTAPAPPALDPSRLLAESYRVARAPTNRLMFAGLLGAAAALTPKLLGSGDLGGGGRSLLIAGSVTVAGVIGYLKGHRTFPLPDNIEQNRVLREQDASLRGAVAVSNARLLAAAPVVVRVEGVAR